jgi:TolB-like protein/Tfp pilus assembly protein PilF
LVWFDKQQGNSMSLFQELKRRNVFRVGAAYLVAAWLIIQVVETIFPAFGFSMAAVRIVTIVLAIGFVLVLVFAWVFQWTPEGLKRDREVDRLQPLSRQSAKRLDYIIMLVLALAVGYFAFDKFVLEPRREAVLDAQTAAAVEEAHKAGRSEAVAESRADKSIAVLAFEDLSPEGDHEYFSDGISEELLNLLSRVPELRVISRSSAFSFKGRNLAIPEIARLLNVSNILEGSVRKAGNRVRITVQLIDARTDTHLWSEVYERTLDDIFAIQDEIAANVVKRLQVTLLGKAPMVRETDSEAYALYLQARYLGRQNTPEAYEQSNLFFQKVLQIDPGFVAAWSGLSTNYGNQGGSGLRPADEAFALAREAAGNALAIDPNYADALLDLGWIAIRFDNDLAAAAGYFERALKIDPTDTTILHGAATLLHYLGRFDQAIELKQYVLARDPVDPISHYNLASSHLSAGRWDDAIASYRSVLRLSPGYIGAHGLIGFALVFKGDAQAALAEFEAEDDLEYRVKGQALAYRALGQTDQFEAKLKELIETWGDQWPSEVAHVYAFTGNADAAFEWLERAIDAKEEGLTEQFLWPFYQPIHADPRWSAFLERVGSSPRQLDALQFTVTLPE